MEPWFSAKNLFFPQSRREFLRTTAIGLSGLTLGLPTSIQAVDDNPRPLVDRVRRAIERGVQFLRDQENNNGDWELDMGLANTRQGGETSLVLLALLNSGVKPDDPIIERGLKFLRTIEPR